MTFIVCSTKNREDSGVFCWAFDSDLVAAKKFAADMTRTTWEAWSAVGSPSGFSGCEGLRLYVHESADGAPSSPVCVFVQGVEYAPNRFE